MLPLTDKTGVDMITNPALLKRWLDDTDKLIEQDEASDNMNAIHSTRLAMHRREIVARLEQLKENGETIRLRSRQAATTADRI
jgi:hypothetical protein